MQSPTKLVPSMISLVPAPAQVFIAILSIQLGAVFAVSLFPVLGPIGTVFFRLAISALLLYVLIRPKFDRKVWQHRYLLLTYGVALGLMNWCFYESIARIPLGIAVTIEFMGPLLVAAISSKSRLEILWILIAFAGILILTPNIGDELDTLGVVFAVLAGIGWGGFIILSKQINKVLPGSDGLAIGMIVASIFIFPFVVSNLSVSAIDAYLVGNLVMLALLSTTIPFYLEFSALKKMTSQAYGVLITLEPAVAAVIGMIALGDVLGINGLVAIVFVTVAAVGSTLTQKPG
ncbi:MAG: EamA family transporter [Pseudomonadota bacterium]